MELDRVAVLIERLAAATKKKEFKWESDASNSFYTHIGDFKISIIVETPEYDYSADPDYSLSIRSTKENGQWVDSFSDEDLKTVMPKSFEVMRDLYTDARRQANDVEGVVENLIKFIESDF